MRKRRISCAALVWAVLGIAAGARAQSATLQALTPAETATAQAGLDASMLPQGAQGMHVVRGQAFRVRVAGGTASTVLPVQFSLPGPGLVKGLESSADGCGVFLLDAHSQARYQPLADSDNAGLIQCSGVQGVGLAHDSASHPSVLLLFRVHTVHRSWSDPYAASWSENDGRYTLEHLEVPASGSLTIASLRRFVEHRK